MNVKTLLKTCIIYNISLYLYHNQKQIVVMAIKGLVNIERFRKYNDINGIDINEGCEIEVHTVIDGVAYCTETEAYNILGVFNVLFDDMIRYCSQ